MPISPQVPVRHGKNPNLQPCSGAGCRSWGRAILMSDCRNKIWIRFWTNLDATGLARAHVLWPNISKGAAEGKMSSTGQTKQSRLVAALPIPVSVTGRPGPSLLPQFPEHKSPIFLTPPLLHSLPSLQMLTNTINKFMFAIKIFTHQH